MSRVNRGKPRIQRFFVRILLGQEIEFQDSEKPDGLRFIRGAQFDRFGNGLITSRSSVLLLYKGAWKEKGTLSGALR
jgi:hypothetical protein